MINEIIKPFESILTALPYVDKYGGLAIPMRRIDNNDMGLRETSIFPVSCGMTERECWEQGKYGDLVPDDRLKSVFYFENISDLQPTGQKQKNLIPLVGVIRLVGWLNLAKLGHNDKCSIAAPIQLSLIQKLEGDFKFEDSPLDKAKMEVKLLRSVIKSPNIFSSYTYGNNVLQFLLHPYDYFALDFKVTVTVNTKCVTDFIPNSPVDCPNPLI